MGKKLSVILTLVLIYELKKVKSGDCNCGIGRESKIIGGSKVSPNEFPWHVALVYRGKYHCGGSLINEKYVLTAAHCILQVDPTLLWVITGAHNLTNLNSDQVSHHRIRKIKAHKCYDYDTLQEDIGLLELQTRVNITDYVRPVCLPKLGEIYIGYSLTTIGWGVHKENNFEASTELLKTNLVGQTNSKCQAIYDKVMTSNQMCAGPVEGGSSACKGDSGGPLLLKNGNRWFLVGIVSFGKGCSDKEKPGVYVQVNKYLRWIKENTLETNICTT